MKDRLKAFVFTYLLFVLVFVLQKPAFVLYYGILPEEGGAAAFFNIILHGLKLDASLAGYLTALPALMLIVSVFMNGKWLATAAKIYFGIVAVLLSAIFTVDMGLYEYWGFRLDATPLFYFFSSPKDALASGERMDCRRRSACIPCICGIALLAVCLLPASLAFESCPS